jgi:hypothetical protein
MSYGFSLYPPKAQFFDDDGNPLALGSVEIYDAGTAVLSAVFSDNPLTTPQSNPIALNARGEPASPIFLEVAAYYDIVVKDADGATVYTVDGFTIQATVTSDYIYRGAGSPEGVVAAAIGGIYQRTDGGAGTTLYVKESGAGNTGWVAK